MFIRNLSTRERYIALATFLIILVALTYNFIIEPVSRRWVHLDNEIASKINTLKKDSKLLSMYKTLESDYAKVSQYVKSQKREEEELTAILTEIETVSRNSSCLIVSIKPIGTKNFPSYKEVLIDATAEANINQFSKFLYEMENSKNMILKVKRFTLSSKSGQQDTLRGAFLISKILID